MHVTFSTVKSLFFFFIIHLYLAGEITWDRHASFHTVIRASTNNSWLKQLLLWCLSDGDWVYYFLYIYLESYCKEDISHPLPPIHSFIYIYLNGLNEFLYSLCYSTVAVLLTFFLKLSQLSTGSSSSWLFDMSRLFYEHFLIANRMF